MDLRGLGAFLSAIAGYFSAQAGAQAGQLQGLLMGEELTERRKRMKMAEESHELQKRLAEAEERRKEELFPLTKRGMEQQLQQQEELFPYQKEALATQVERSKLDLENTRLWTLYQRGVAPSQIADPVLRAQYEPFYNFQMAVRNLDAVMSEEDLQAVLGMLPEDQRRSVEILGRAKLFENQTRRQMMERHMQGVDLNLAQGEFQLRTAKLNFALNTILNNINSEGTAWDKRTPQQKIEAVKKWIEQLGLQDVVPENFANMFQKVQSSDARQLALLQAQINMQLRANMSLAQQQFGFNRILQNEMWMSNIVGGALQAGAQQGLYGNIPVGGGIAPVGFAVPQPPTFFETTRDNRGSQLNLSLLNKYVQVPFDVPVPISVRGQMTTTNLGQLQGQVLNIYKRLDNPNASITADEISTLITFDAGLHYANMLQSGMGDWNLAVDMGVSRILPVLKSLNLYRTNINFKKVVDDWERAYYARRAQRQPAQTAPQQRQPAQTAPQQRQPAQTAPQQRRPASLPFVERPTAQRGGR